MAFKRKAPEVPPPATPEELYGELPHRVGAVGSLWLHQGDLLRQYAREHPDTPDLALELPTGTGKTLPGLLIADWSRRVRRGRVVYACPTKQLVRQVAATAEREGIPAVVLVGSHREWSIADQGRYEGAEAVAIVTYSTVFNSNPKLAQPDLLLFDDAHAGEQYVAEAYSLLVRRAAPGDAYARLLEAVAPALDTALVTRLLEGVPDPSAQQQVRLVVPLRQPGMVEAIIGVLADLPLYSDERFKLAMIRNGMASTLVYVSYSSILIRPIVPPTEENPLFSHARQRVYLSATLGEGGELERAFGRAPIVRLALPGNSPSPRSGRRFFVFPELAEGIEPRNLAAKVVAMAGKALVLAPDTETAVGTAQELAQDGWEVFGVADVADGMKPFADSEHATCGLASRYDGLDLPGSACRAVVLEGTPDQDNLQERFLSERVRAGSALAERVRTRVVQGAGRCTRGPDDWALVVVLGADLTRYLLRPETLRALAPELQGEIEFGIDNSRGADEADVLDNVAAFLAQNDAWHDDAEPVLADLRRRARRQSAPSAKALAGAAALELEAGQLAAVGRWADAGRVATEAARALGQGGDATRGYRALWLILAGTWTDQAAADVGQGAGRATARALIKQAEQAARPGTWTRELAPLPEVAREAPGAADVAAIAAVAALASRVAAGAQATKIEVMFAALAERDATKYEPGLTALGKLLGAEASKPPGSGRCDSTWCWDERLWLALEAKSEHVPRGLVPHKDVRQANDQLRLLATDRKTETIPPDSATVIVSPKPAIDPSGAAGAEAHVHFTHPDTVVAIARDAEAAWEQIMAGRTGLNETALRRTVELALSRHGVLATQVFDRLTRQRVSTQQNDD